MRVEQSPSKSIQEALSPSLKALVGDELLRHSDADVKVSVASCITEITRITAPEAPYEDEMMRVSSVIYSRLESLLRFVTEFFISVILSYLILLMLFY